MIRLIRYLLGSSLVFYVTVLLIDIYYLFEAGKAIDAGVAPVLHGWFYWRITLLLVGSVLTIAGGVLLSFGNLDSVDIRKDYKHEQKAGKGSNTVGERGGRINPRTGNAYGREF